MTQLPLLTDADHEELLAILAFAASQAVACEEQGDPSPTGSEDEEIWRGGGDSLVSDWWDQLDANEAWIAKEEARGEWDTDEMAPEEYK